MKALLPVTATIPVTLVVINDPKVSPEKRNSHSSAILEVEGDRPLPKLRWRKPRSVLDKAGSAWCEARTEQKERQPSILQKRRSLLKPVIAPEERVAAEYVKLCL